MVSTGSVIYIFFFVAVFPSIFADQLLWGNVQLQLGDLSDWEKCPHNKYAVAARLKVQPDTGDHTSINGIELGCDHLNSLPKQSYTHTVKGLEGPAGSWTEWFHCAQGFSGYQFRAEAQYGKVSGDDFAASELQLLCDKTWIYLGGTYDGYWFPQQSCGDNLVFCGIQTLVEPFVSGGDNTALNSANMECCPVNQ